MSGGNWWRANEIVVIRHHSRESETAKVPVSIPRREIGRAFLLKTGR
jgi:hypothetical protein